MSTLKQMLSMNNGSFQKAEKMALEMISKGHPEVYLDLSLLKHAQGDIKGAKQALNEYERISPNDLTTVFAKKWFELSDGNLQSGSEHIEAGRQLGILGIQKTILKSPRWDGRTKLNKKIVVLVCEGGFGDQIMCVRFAKHLSDLGATVIVDCSPGLVSLFSRVPRVSTTINTGITRGPVESLEVDGISSCQDIHHDYQVLSMNAFGSVNCKWDTLWPGKYIYEREDLSVIWSRIIPKSKKLNVGLRWTGNPQFENAQFRRFPPELLNKVGDIKNMNFWSLQKDDNSFILHENINNLESFLSTWEQTAAAISRMDLVITSCTSIAHLAGAMNIPTWVIVPAMSYHPWARPGKKSSWYPSVTLYRQKCYGDWQPPFDELYIDLKALARKS